MAYTPVKMAWHTSKHMQGSSSQDAHINHGKNDKCPNPEETETNITQHSCNNIQGIKMNSNEHGAME